MKTLLILTIILEIEADRRSGDAKHMDMHKTTTKVYDVGKHAS